MYRSSDPNALVTISKGTVKSGPFLGLLGLWARGVVELGLLVNPATRLEALPVLDSEVVAFGVDAVGKSKTHTVRPCSIIQRALKNQGRLTCDPLSTRGSCAD